MLWQGAKWRILKNFKLQNEECHNYGSFKKKSLIFLIEKNSPHFDIVFGFGANFH